MCLQIVTHSSNEHLIVDLAAEAAKCSNQAEPQFFLTEDIKYLT